MVECIMIVLRRNKAMDNMLPELITFGNNVKQLRTKRGLSIKKAAESIQYDRGCWSRMEKGQQDIEMTTVVKIAKMLDVYLPLLFSRNSFGSNGNEMVRGFVNEDYLMIFASNVRRILEKLNKKQVYIYAVTGMDESNVNRILCERSTNPQVSTLAKISTELKQDMAFMLSRNG